MLLCTGLSSRLERAIELLRLDTEESTKRCCRDPSFPPPAAFYVYPLRSQGFPEGSSWFSSAASWCLSGLLGGRRWLPGWKAAPLSHGVAPWKTHTHTSHSNREERLNLGETGGRRGQEEKK